MTSTRTSIDGFDEIRRHDFNVGGITFQLAEYGQLGNPFKFKPTTQILPVDLVTGLVNATYVYPDQKQAVLDALTPFQITSKLWVNQILVDVLSPTVQTSRQMVVIGSWYGQQIHLMQRNPRIHMHDTILVDQDPQANAVSIAIGEADKYGAKSIVKRITADIFDSDVWMLEKVDPAWSNRDPQSIYIWNGLEHFEPEPVKEFIDSHKHATFCIQGTNMPADDHKFLCNDIQDLLEYVPADRIDNVKYAGQIDAPFGSRFMVIFEGQPY